MYWFGVRAIKSALSQLDARHRMRSRRTCANRDLVLRQGRVLHCCSSLVGRKRLRVSGYGKWWVRHRQERDGTPADTCCANVVQRTWAKIAPTAEPCRPL